MKRVNKETAIKISIISLIIALNSYLVFTNKISKFLSSRITVFVICSIVILCFVDIVLIFDLFKADNIRRKKIKYIIFLLPVIILLVNTILITGSSNSSYNEIKRQIIENREVAERPDVEQVNINDKKVIINEKNYINFVNEFYSDYKKFIGKSIEIDGNICCGKDNEFILYRKIIVCCSADAVNAGFFCRSDNKINIKNDSYVKVQGKIIENGIIKVTKIEKQ